MVGRQDDLEAENPEEAQGGKRECPHTTKRHRTRELCPGKAKSPGLHENPTSCGHQHPLLGGELENFIPPQLPSCALLIND